MNERYLLRKSTGDLPLEGEDQITDLFRKGQCKAGDALYDFSQQKWLRVGDFPKMAELFGPKPASIPEKKLIYFVQPGSSQQVMGPFSMKEMQQRMKSMEVCETTWVFVEGDKEWRQIKGVKVLLELLTPLPSDVPTVEAAAAASSFDLNANLGEQSDPSIRLDVAPEESVEREDPTMAFSALGLSALRVDHSKPQEAPPAMASGLPPAPPIRPIPPSAPAVAPPAAPPAAPMIPKAPEPSLALDSGGPAVERDPEGSFDGITAEIPTDPIWLLKQATSENVSGPFPFLDVIKFLEEGRINKNDKISKTGSNRFVKISQQYEFNVKFSVEVAMVNGVEKKKILIKRRHPRVPYFTEVQILTKGGYVAGNCVNVSAGGILVEVSKATFNLGDILEIKMLPGIINRSISCKSLVIGKIPKIPPGFALKFEDLKPEDKEAIEFFVQESLKREMLQNS